MKCINCLKKTSSMNITNCKWCNVEMCMKCAPIEKHHCEAMQKCKEFEKNKLTCKLEECKTTSTSNYTKI